MRNIKEPNLESKPIETTWNGRLRFNVNIRASTRDRTAWGTISLFILLGILMGTSTLRTVEISIQQFYDTVSSLQINDDGHHDDDDETGLQSGQQRRSNRFKNVDFKNQNYTWGMYHWIVPSSSGIPIFSQEDMLDAFMNVDTLWIGDSTTRRAYATLYAILNHTSNTSSSETSINDIPEVELGHPNVIDMNKFAHNLEPSCEDRKAHNNATFSRPGMHDLWTVQAVCRSLPRRRKRSKIHEDIDDDDTTTATTTTAMGNNNHSSSFSSSLFDYARVDCLRDLHRIAELEDVLKRYSLIIIGVGIHDALRKNNCRMSQSVPKVNSPPVENETLLPEEEEEQGQDSIMSIEDVFDQYGWKGVEDIATALQRVHSHDDLDEDGNLVASRTTAVLWRTTGFSWNAPNETTRDVLQMNEKAKINVADRLERQIQNASSTNNKNGRIQIVDWGTAIYPRSFRPNRIEGDLAPHYGLEARLLMVQMTTQQVLDIFSMEKEEEEEAEDAR